MKPCDVCERYHGIKDFLPKFLGRRIIGIKTFVDNYCEPHIYLIFDKEEVLVISLSFNSLGEADDFDFKVRKISELRELEDHFKILEKGEK